MGDYGDALLFGITGEKGEKGVSAAWQGRVYLVGGNPIRVIASHEPGIEPCGACGNVRVDA